MYFMVTPRPEPCSVAIFTGTSSELMMGFDGEMIQPINKKFQNPAQRHTGILEILCCK